MFYVKNKRIPDLPEGLKKEALSSLMLGAEWLVRNQVRDAWPAWDANKGRFPYHVFIDPARQARKPLHLSTCWKTARGAMGLYAAHLVTDERSFLDAANRAMDYLLTLQFFEPGYEAFHGAFREDSPQGPHIMLRDTIIAVQAFINAHAVTNEPIHLNRARRGAEWLLAHFQSKYFPSWYVYPMKDMFVMTNVQVAYWLYAAAQAFAQMFWLTGDKKFVREGVVPMMDHVTANYVLPGGAFGLKANGGIEKHHVSIEAHLHNALSDDDGIGCALLSAYKVTGDEAYLAAAEGMGAFWLDEAHTPEVFSGFPSIIILLADLHRLTGADKYVPAIERLCRGTLNLQYMGAGEPLLHGGFSGEDMAERYDRTSRPEDYIELRVTALALMAFAKVAAQTPAQWNCAHSCFGW